MKRIAYFAAAAALLLAVSCDKENEEHVEFVAIDLGLSVKWANANLGATAPEGYGDYYAWGETDTKHKYSGETYKWRDKFNNLTKYNTFSSFGSVDNKTVLDAEDDVAHVKLGGRWRIPTGSEVDELIATRNNSSYRWEWTSLNGHNGWLVTYLVNDNSLFLPAAGFRDSTDLYFEGTSGYYWTSSLFLDDPYGAYRLHFVSNGENRVDDNRYLGYSVRPVSD